MAYGLKASSCHPLKPCFSKEPLKVCNTALWVYQVFSDNTKSSVCLNDSIQNHLWGSLLAMILYIEQAVPSGTFFLTVQLLSLFSTIFKVGGTDCRHDNLPRKSSIFAGI